MASHPDDDLTKAPAPAETLPPDSIIAGRHRLVALLGRGGMGQVYRAADLTLDHLDGEDLASLLRRIGRIPQDKAIEIARQLCAGAQSLTRGAGVAGQAAPVAVRTFRSAVLPSP